MEFRYIKLVEAVHRTGSLKGAANDLHLTQSALSHQLRQLEEALNVKVFYRTNNQLSFTPAGKELLEAAEVILTRVEKLHGRIDEIKSAELKDYIHGFSGQESQRLYDQASSIAQFIHWDSYWDAGTSVLEAGCGVGAQTEIIAQQNPATEFVAVDISGKSLTTARKTTAESGITNVSFKKADLRKLPYQDGTFDHVFVCFVLEHLRDPTQVLKELNRVLKSGGSITVIEGDHGSTYFYPDSDAAKKVVAAQVELQQRNGGNANISRTLYPLLASYNFENINVSPRQIYVDASKPELVDGFIRKTFTAMIEGIADEAISQNIVHKTEMEKGISDLHKTTDEAGTFCYTFFKAIAIKP